MKTIRSLMALCLTVTMASTCVCAQNSPEPRRLGHDMEGYIILEDIPTYKNPKCTTRSNVKIEKNRGCVFMLEGGYSFPEPDAAESINVNVNPVEYFEPAQDLVDALYVPKKSFEQSTRPVTFLADAPQSWTIGEPVMLKSDQRYSCDVKITPLQVTDPDAVYITYEDEGDTQVAHSLTNAVVYEVVLMPVDLIPVTTYVFDGEELFKFIPEGEMGHGPWPEKFWMEDGKFYYSDELHPRVPISRLAKTYDIPSIAFLGWLDADHVMVDSYLHHR